ncbi:MAG: uroporphyrinogen decarboxylase family protein [Candidatus Sumerlaeota bacterium]
MNNIERFKAVMGFQPFDRLPLVEWAPWWKLTIERWREEGLPNEVETVQDIQRYFGLDIYRQTVIRCQGWDCPRPEAHGMGIIQNEEDYERILPTLYPWPQYQEPDGWPVVDAEHWKRLADSQASGEEVTWLTLDGFFWLPRTLLGIERHLYAFYEQPDLMHRICQDLADWQLRVIEEVSKYCTPAFMTFAEDMSYNHGPMLSEDLFNEFMKPYYHQVVPAVKEMGTLAIIDSDGDITRAVPWFKDAGLDGILPIERQAGTDISAIRKDYPHMRFIGCFDKMCMDKGEAAMRAEFERLLPVAAQGGLIISCDHQTPPAVSIEDYRLYVELFKEYAEKAGEMSRERENTQA